MINTPIKLKTASLTLSGFIAMACLVAPLTVLADTSDSIDAIMQQMKSFKAPVPKVSTPEPVKTETEEKKAEEPVKTEEKPAIESKSSVYVAPQELETEKKMSSSSVSKQVSTQPKATKKKRKSKKRRARRQTSNKGSAVDYKGFNEQYMSLINDILNEKEPTSSKSTNTRPVQVTQGSNFAGTSGWIYLGKYRAGRWLASKSLKSGNALPVAGQQYTVKSPLLNMRKTRPLKSGLGKLMQVLHVGDKVQVNRVHRSSNNNYWANVVRP
jgi:hypothetical protein